MFRLEVVVVDDGSVDDTPDVLGRYPVRVVRTTGYGIPGARNTGLHAASGDLLMFLDDDDELLPAAISSQLVEFERHPEFAAVFGRAQRTDENLVPFGQPFPDANASSGWILEALLGYQPQIATMLIRRDVAAQLGGFNLRYAGDDEWDFFLRLARRWPLGRIPDSVLLFRQRAGAEEEQQWRRSRYVREMFHVNTSHLGWTERLRLRPVLWRVRGGNCYTFSRYAVENLPRPSLSQSVQIDVVRAALVACACAAQRVPRAPCSNWRVTLSLVRACRRPDDRRRGWRSPSPSGWGSSPARS